MQDLRMALRQLWKRPALTVVATLTLGLGIAANGIVFTWVRAILLDTIPGARNPGELVVLAPRHPEQGLGESMSIPDLRVLERDSGALAGATGADMEPFAIRMEGRTEWVWGQPTLANFFEVLGVVPVLGRGFATGEDRPGAPTQVVVISHRFWRTRMEGRTDVLGQVIHVNERALTVVGVAPPEFQGTISGLGFDLWVPLASVVSEDELRRRDVEHGWRSMHGIARLSPGVGRREAAVRCETVAGRLRAEFPNSHARLTFEVLPLWRSPWGGQSYFGPALMALSVVGALLLMLVTANLANLQLVRAMARESEMAVRLAVGASRWRLVRQLLLESLALGALGGVLGLGLSAPGARLLKALMPPSYLPLQLGLTADYRVALALAGVTVGVSLLFGLAPVRHALNQRIQEALKVRGRGTTAGSGHRLRQAFVVTQVALAAGLLVGMG
ncbi:MAG: ABC transporter permease, partial [Verrucomicrobiales bacterium]|nr:ABC transporter permease [Verrucomicrobiales bacterium]